MEILGIDVGGSGIKGAVVDVRKGKLVTERIRIATPRPALPEKIASSIHRLKKDFSYTGKVGVGFPTIVKNGKCLTWGNLEPEWQGVKIEKLFTRKLNLPVCVINDADAAGLAEIEFGEGRKNSGLVITITIGTGIGSGVFYNGKLIPNIEFGRILDRNGGFIERYVSDKTRQDENLDWKEWAQRFNQFLEYLVRISAPDLVILGGGASKKFDLYAKYLTAPVKIKTARFRNKAGIIGAAIAASRYL